MVRSAGGDSLVRRSFGRDSSGMNRHLTLQTGRVAYLTETGILVHSRAPQGYPVWEHIPLGEEARSGLKVGKHEILDFVNRCIGELASGNKSGSATG